MNESPTITLTANLQITHPDGSFVRHSVEVTDMIKIEGAIADLQAVARTLCKSVEEPLS